MNTTKGTGLALAAAAVALMLVGAALLGLLGAFSFFSTAAVQEATRGSAASYRRCLPTVTADGAAANPLVGTITSEFGPRANPFGPGVIPEGFTSEEPLVHHYGLDIAGVPAGTPFYSGTSGVVKAVGVGSGNGIIVTVDERTEAWYWHSAPGTTKVTAGQQIQAGTELAGVGHSGASVAVGGGAADHLHVEIRIDGQPVDPGPWFAAHGVHLGTGAAETTVRTSHPSATAPEITAESQPAEQKQDVDLSRPVTLEGPTGQITFEPPAVENAAAILAAGRAIGVPDRAVAIALATSIVESYGLQMTASTVVPESLAYDHQRTGSDHDSVGLFQQRPSQGWGTVEELMDPTYSARAFFGGPTGPNQGDPAGLLDVPGWEQLSFNDAAQATQRSGVPNAYGPWEQTAYQLLEHLAGTTPAQCTPGAAHPVPATDTPGQNPGPRATGQDEDQARTAILAAARQGVGGAYVWGGNTYRAWDCSGYVQWVYGQAGIRLPRIQQWSVGQKTTDPQPGDLVVQNPSAPGSWDHVGIYAGEGKMWSALNPLSGTLLHPVDWNPGTEYFVLLPE